MVLLALGDAHVFSLEALTEYLKDLRSDRLNILLLCKD